MLTAGAIRKLIEGKPDDFVIPFYVEYDEVCNDYVFVRTESLDVIYPPHPLVAASEAPGILHVVSLVSPEDIDEEGSEEGEDTDFSKTVPLACPHCKADLTKPESIDVVLSLLDTPVEFPTSADNDGNVIDTPSDDIADGHLSSMTCAKCNQSLEDLEET
jgi:hypothetical protein